MAQRSAVFPFKGGLNIWKIVGIHLRRENYCELVGGTRLLINIILNTP